MKIFELFVNLLSILVIGFVKRVISEEYHICSCEDPQFLGTYTKSVDTMDGAPVYTNMNEMSFFRNNGFWYIGNLAPWPPETHYRCVEPEGCNYQEMVPPTNADGEWKGSKKFDKTTAPVISAEPCGASIGNEEL